MERPQVGYRNFRDANGIGWQAWDVNPRMAERRRGDRRRGQQPISFPERRRPGIERRVNSRPRGVLTEGLAQGWLAFESEQEERRRLAPIPADWLRCTDERLEEYCEQAREVRRTGGFSLDN